MLFSSGCIFLHNISDQGELLVYKCNKNSFVQEFNPEKYHHLLGIFAQSYLNTGNPVSIVSVFLKAYTKGEVTEVPESCKPFSDKNYDKRKAYVGKPLRSQLSMLL